MELLLNPMGHNAELSETVSHSLVLPCLTSKSPASRMILDASVSWCRGFDVLKNFMHEIFWILLY